MPRRPPLLMTLFLLAAPLAGADDRRPLVPDDLFRIEEVGEVAIAPDGSEAAVVIKAPVRPGRGHGRPLLLGGDRSDVFLARTGGGEPARLTDGRGDSSGSWRPLWSPDGRYLAMLSTRGDDNVRLHVWDRRTGTILRPAEDGVDLWAAVEPATKAPFAWLGDHRLLVALVAPGASHESFKLDWPARAEATAAWGQASRGDGPTASAVDSVPARPAPGPPTGRLALVDVGSGVVSTVAEGNVIEALASPDGGRVAVVVEAGRYRPREGTPLTHFTDRSPSRLGVASLAGGPASARWVGGIEPRTKIRRTQLTWAADGSAVAVFARPEEAKPEALYLVDAEGTARVAGGDDFHATATARVGGTLLALGPGRLREAGGLVGDRPRRRDAGPDRPDRQPPGRPRGMAARRTGVGAGGRRGQALAARPGLRALRRGPARRGAEADPGRPAVLARHGGPGRMPPGGRCRVG